MRQKIISLVLLFAMAGLLSCNNGEKKSETTTSGDTTTSAAVDTSKKKAADPRDSSSLQADLLPPLPTFKITRAQLIAIDEENPRITKLIIQTGFNDINDPVTMRLYMYNGRSHRHYGREQTPVALEIDLTAMGYNVNENFILGNVDINFDEIRKEYKHGNTWDTDLNYLRLRPITRTLYGKEYLSFNFTRVDNDGSIKDFLTGELNPSPPAKPNPED